MGIGTEDYLTEREVWSTDYEDYLTERGVWSTDYEDCLTERDSWPTDGEELLTEPAFSSTGHDDWASGVWDVTPHLDSDREECEGGCRESPRGSALPEPC